MNLVAAALMLAVLRHGIPAGGSTLDARMAYIHAHEGLWRFGWLAWNAAAISLLAFYVALGLRWFREAPLRCGLAIALGAAGVAADLVAETTLMIVEPGLSQTTFATTEATVIALTGFLANGLYTLAGIALTWAGARELPRAIVYFAVPVWGAGLALSATVLAHSQVGQFASTAALMPLFVLWAMSVGVWLRSRAS